MTIADLRVVNENLKTDQGDLKAPTSFFMDVEDEHSDRFTIPIDQSAYMALTSLYSDRKPLDPAECS